MPAVVATYHPSPSSGGLALDRPYPPVPAVSHLPSMSRTPMKRPESASGESSFKATVTTQKASSGPKCVSCGATTTPLWRRNEMGATKLHGSRRPVTMKKAVIKRRKRVPAANAIVSTPNQADSPGHYVPHTSTLTMADRAAAEALVAVGRSGGDDRSRKRQRREADSSVVERDELADEDYDDGTGDESAASYADEMRAPTADSHAYGPSGASPPAHPAPPRDEHRRVSPRGGGYDLPPLNSAVGEFRHGRPDEARGPSPIRRDVVDPSSRYLPPPHPSYPMSPRGRPSHLRSMSPPVSRSRSPGGRSPRSDMHYMSAVPTREELLQHQAQLREQKRVMEDMLRRTESLLRGVERGLESPYSNGVEAGAGETRGASVRLPRRERDGEGGMATQTAAPLTASESLSPSLGHPPPSFPPTPAPHPMSTSAHISPALPAGRPTPKPLSINEQDEDVLMAVKALGDMRNQRISPTSPTHPQGSPTLVVASASVSPDQPAHPGFSPTAVPAMVNGEYGQGAVLLPGPGGQADFVSRVSHFPIVRTAIGAYESSKNSSRVVKLGAEMVESSIATLSRPVMERLPVAQMDGFACRQLDKLEGRTRSYSGSQPTSAATASDTPARDWEVNTPTSMKAMYSHPENPSSMSLDTQGTYSSETLPPLSPSTTRDMDAPQQSQSSRAGWQTMLVGAGGLSAAVSDENMRRLQLCLDWLRWATRITNQHINILRNFLASLSMPPPHPESTPISPASARTLAEAQTGVVDAIKQVVNIVSSYAGSALREPARSAVRKWILELPERWRAATQLHERGAPPPQTLMTPDGQLPSYTTAKTMAHKVLALALESLDMLSHVTSVFLESLQAAEAWLDRFGRNRNGPPSALSSGATTPNVPHPPHSAYPWTDGKQDPYAHNGYYGYPQPQIEYGYKDARDGQPLSR
ncbi:Opi1-domain-containing protein [Calocera cornea HHB12733]|uniref:Opi1-domain-containing protein n=1 Tax=Calocera cornea HHB12733 TaxID=1353952 RepID=A0A165HAL1_9BASI|nr:Opi1-domain-containing protein [Calocera cornea HHB12733]